MAEQRAEKRPEAAAGGGAKAPAVGGLLTKTPVVLGVVMLLEAVVLFVGFKFVGGAPKAANGADLTDIHKPAGDKSTGNADDKKREVEIDLLEFKAPNKLSGRTFLYDVSIYVTTKAEFESRVKDAIKDRDALIKDRVRTIIAESDPEKLGGGSEPGLETLRRQVKYQLDEMLGEGLVDEVLVPRCIPFRADY